MSRARLALAMAVLVAIVAGISWLGIDVMRQIDRERESRTDNAQWSLSQIEVEVLYLISAADAAQHGTVSLDKVRLRYDILYSRLETLRIGRVFGGLRETPNFIEGIGRLDTFMNGLLPIIDGADDAMRAHLPALQSTASAMIVDARIIALTGVEMIAAVSDRRRAEVASSLIVAGALTLFLVAALVALLLLLLRLFQFNRMRSAENLATLKHLDAVVSTALEAMVTVDAMGRIVDFNPAACQTFGYSRAEAVGADMADLLTVPGQSLFRHAAAPDIEGQGRFRIMARHKDGRSIPAEVSISRMTAGQETLFVTFLRDLSAQLAAEHALVAARDKAMAGEKAKTDLLVVMSHEIRTPLNGMIGTIDLLESTDLQPHQREYLRIMEASGKLLMHHVNDVLDVARLDSGKMPFVPGPVDLADLVREVIENQTPASLANGNDMTFTGPADGRTMVECDGAQLRQILLNLVGNAVKFTRNGKISVEVTHTSATGPTEIRVRDTGIGIPDADVGRIFDDFVTLDASYARSTSGTGLGLGIVRRIVNQMGGTLAVDSQKNRGSLFRVTLPLPILAKAAPALPDKPPPDWPPPDWPQPNWPPLATDTAGTRKLVTLVVEDNDFNRLIVREMLLKEGHEVVEARNGDEGIALAAARQFDLILMDISMPGIDGLQAAHAIRTGRGASRRTAIVAMTAHALAEETARFRAGGMVAVLLKPITREALKAVIQRPAPRAGQPEDADHKANRSAGFHNNQAIRETPDQNAVSGKYPDPAALLVDRRVLDAMIIDLGPDKALHLLHKFRSEAAAAVTRITATLAVAPPDQTMIRDLHRLAGSAGMFGACGLQTLLAEVETAWKTDALAQAAILLARLQDVWLATEAAYHAGAAHQEGAALAQPSSLR